jgi:predicted GH43/DUF377 family glycosyl hydrolase
MTNVNRTEIRLLPDNRRVILRPFVPNSEKKLNHIISRIISMQEERAEALLNDVLKEFSTRHRNISSIFLQNFDNVKHALYTDDIISEKKKLLLGAYLTHEYSFESSALFNPSIVPHPEQSGLPKGSKRFILSLRSVGEGHISSITFRNGVVAREGRISIEKASDYAVLSCQSPNQCYEKNLFTRKLKELSLISELTTKVIEKLPPEFTFENMYKGLVASLREDGKRIDNDFSARGMLMLAQSNYSIFFDDNKDISENVIFPRSPHEICGIEDARFVLFTDDDGGRKYYATYTAYDGKIILPQILETENFKSFTFITLNGTGVQNKGMALFPRKINGRYAMITRQDGENLFIMYSDNIHFWYDPEIIVRPTFPWEFYQIGNCGSPLETEKGWLLLIHGVGPMRRYCVGAVLLDHDNPSKIIARTKKPLIEPNDKEREGYVPNVVYSCGAMIHGDNLIIPYAMSDFATTFATVNLEELLSDMIMTKNEGGKR